MFFITDRRS